MSNTCTKFHVARNRLGTMPTLDEIEATFAEAKRLLEDSGLTLELSTEGSLVALKASDDLSYITVSQHHHWPQAWVHRELSRNSKVKTPSPERIVQLITEYFP